VNHRGRPGDRALACFTAPEWAFVALGRPALRACTPHEMFEAFDLRSVEYLATLRGGLSPP